MKVLIRGKAVNATLVSKNEHTVWVRLWNGDLVKRHKGKHVVEWDPRWVGVMTGIQED